MQVRSSNGRALVSKTRCCGFESHRACHSCIAFRGTDLLSPALETLFLPRVRGDIEGCENAMFRKLVKFLREVKLELKKVSWPSRREISGSTGVVIVSVIIVAFYLGILDTVLQQIMILLH
jgi:preprotein translocase SecE subunit